MSEILEQIGYIIVACLGIGWFLLRLIHYLTPPLSENDVRRIIREELKRFRDSCK